MLDRPTTRLTGPSDELPTFTGRWQIHLVIIMLLGETRVEERTIPVCCTNTSQIGLRYL